MKARWKGWRCSVSRCSNEMVWNSVEESKSDFFLATHEDCLELSMFSHIRYVESCQLLRVGSKALGWQG